MGITGQALSTDCIVGYSERVVQYHLRYKRLSRRSALSHAHPFFGRVLPIRELHHAEATLAFRCEASSFRIRFSMFCLPTIHEENLLNDCNRDVTATAKTDTIQGEVWTRWRAALAHSTSAITFILLTTGVCSTRTLVGR